jgi:DNA topoisomerase-1
VSWQLCAIEEYRRALVVARVVMVDPRLAVVLAKKFDMPFERIFSKPLRYWFRWAIK